MIALLIGTAVTLAALLILWTIYLAYTALLAQWASLRWEVKAAGLLVVAVGWLIDVVINWTLGLALGITPDLTLSQKCGRLKSTEDWRAPVACYLCRAWLDPFQIGGHCR